MLIRARLLATSQKLILIHLSTAMPKAISLKFRSTALTLLGLGLGYLVLIFSSTLVYAAYFQTGRPLTPEFMAFAAICGVFFSALGAYVAAFFARRSPVVHAVYFCLMLSLVYTLPSLLFGTRESLFVHVINVAIAILGSLIGGWFRYWQIHRQRDRFTLA